MHLKDTIHYRQMWSEEDTIGQTTNEMEELFFAGMHQHFAQGAASLTTNSST